MDGGTFDRLTRLLAGQLTRRTGLAGALAALAAGAPALGLDLEARQRRRQGRQDQRRERGASGRANGRDGDGEVFDEKKPCGPKPSDNACRRNKDCCTKYCRKPGKGQKLGRCRCIKPGKKCKGEQKCCGGATCQNRTCTPVAAPTCGAVGGACATVADCCTGLLCESGLCAPCVEKVCASGCEFDNVNDAYEAAEDGDLIYIGPGTYETGIQLTKDITLAACPGITGVILVPDRVLLVDDYYGVLTEDPAGTTRHKATVRNLTFQATDYDKDDTNVKGEAFLISYGKSLIDWTIEGCAFADGAYGLYATMGEHVVRNSTFTRFSDGGVFVEQESTSTALITLTISGSSFTDGDSYGVYFYPYDGNASKAEFSMTDSVISGNAGYQLYLVGDNANLGKQTFTLTNTTISDGADLGLYLYSAPAQVTGCTFTNNMDGGVYIYDCAATLTDCKIQGNKATYSGSGVEVEANFYNAAVTLAGTTMVTGNTVPTGQVGSGVYLNMKNGNIATATGTSTSNVTGNTPDQCYKFVNGDVGATGVKNCNGWT